jgi:peptidoglycan/xylan/chitin deacetylase (PgdA/CDA1 family)
VRRCWLRAAAASVAVVLAVPVASSSAAVATPRPAHPGAHQPCPTAQPRQVARIPAGEAMLTFDDGPDPRWTPKLLAILSTAHVKATFFLVGRNAARYPALVRDIVAAGNVVGNHSWDHASMPQLNGLQQAEEIDRTDKTLRAITGALPCFFRFPYGAATRASIAAVNKRGMTPYYWSVDTRDWAGTSTSGILATVWRELSPTHGAIILQHDIQGARTIAAVAPIIAGLRARHYRFVTADAAHPQP